jgi:hypothetical protein
MEPMEEERPVMEPLKGKCPVKEEGAMETSVPPPPVRVRHRTHPLARKPQVGSGSKGYCAGGVGRQYRRRQSSCGQNGDRSNLGHFDLL